MFDDEDEILDICNALEKFYTDYKIENKKYIDNYICKLNIGQEEYKQKLLKKWNNDSNIKERVIPPSKGNKGGGKNREIIKDNNIYYVIDKCTTCLKKLPIYYFHKANNKRSRNPLDVASGEESCDSICINCKNDITRKRSHEEHEIIRQMIKKDNGDLTNEWVKKQLEKQNKCCDITNIPITLERGYYNTASVQNNGEGNLHYQKNCTLIMTCLQVQEHGILNLKDAWKKILELMKNESSSPTDTNPFLKELDIKFSNTPKENGVFAPTQIYEEDVGICNKLTHTGKICGRVCVKHKKICLTHLPIEEKKQIYDNIELKKEVINIKSKINPIYSQQCIDLHLPYILRNQVERYYKMDKESKRRSEKGNIIKLLPQDIIKKLHDQKGRCNYSGVPFSFKRDDPNYWSLERIDNTKHHTIENTVLICRIMNGAYQLTKDIIQEIYRKKYNNILSNNLNEKEYINVNIKNEITNQIHEVI